MSMTGITVCRDELCRNVCTCADLRCCRTVQTEAADRAQCFSVSLRRDVLIDDNSDSTTRSHPVRPPDAASPPPRRWCLPADAAVNAACALATEKSHLL